MSETPYKPGSRDPIEQAAAAWVLRIDRGLSAAEQDEYSEWLAADPRRGAAVARHRQNWTRLDQLAEWRPEHSAQPNPDLLAPPLRRRLLRFAPVALSLAAALVIAWFAWKPAASPAPQVGSPATFATQNTQISPSQRELEDGTIVELNRGASVSVQFSAGERRVTLERGEAHFAVAKDATRPFIVRASGVEVRAVGTAFNVRVDQAVVEVLVTEGSVRLDAPRGAGVQTPGQSWPVESETALVPVLEAQQRAVLSLASQPAAPQIDTLTTSEIERVLAWQHRLLDLTAAPLNEVVAEFNRRNVVQLVVYDPELASIRVSVAMRSDNVEGFVRLLEAGFGARAERRGDAEILLRKAK